MKDQHDKSTIELCPVAQAPHVPQGRAADARQAKKPRPKRLKNQSGHSPPPGAKAEQEGFPTGFGRSVLPVSAAAVEEHHGVSTGYAAFVGANLFAHNRLLDEAAIAEKCSPSI